MNHPVYCISLSLSLILALKINSHLSIDKVDIMTPIRVPFDENVKNKYGFCTFINEPLSLKSFTPPPPILPPTSASGRNVLDFSRHTSVNEAHGSVFSFFTC